MKGVALALLAMLAMANLMVGPSQAAVVCNTVNGALAPCLSYLTKGGSPPSQCCAGVRNVNSMTPTRADRQAACKCLKQSLSRYKTIRDDAAVSLPQKCNVQVTVPILCNTDCSTIS